MKSSSPRRIKLIYFNGCFNAEKVREALRDLGVEFVEVRQDALAADHPLQRYSSPTVICDGEIVLGSATDGARGCSLFEDRMLGRLMRLAK